jgi:hypothetical protein
MPALYREASQQLWCVSGVSAILISGHFSQQNGCKSLVEAKSVSAVAETCQQISIHLSFFHHNLRWSLRLKFGVRKVLSYLQTSAKPCKINCLYIAKMFTRLCGMRSLRRRLLNFGFFVRITGTGCRVSLHNNRFGFAKKSASTKFFIANNSKKSPFQLPIPLSPGEFLFLLKPRGNLSTQCGKPFRQNPFLNESSTMRKKSEQCQGGESR